MLDSHDRTTARIYRMLSIVAGLAAIVLALFYYMSLQMAGFPDSSFTELDRAQAKFYPAFIALSIACGLYFIYISFTATNMGMRWKFVSGLIVYLLILGTTVAIDYYLSLILDDGMGG